MKGGIVYSNFVTTVSPQHTLGGALHRPGRWAWGTRCRSTADKFGGVLNGVDYDVWNPEIDRPHPGPLRRRTRRTGKYRNKEALRDRLWLRNEYKPLIAYVGRLDRKRASSSSQHAIFYALAHGAQFVLLG